MSKLSITFQFDSEAEAQSFLSKLLIPTEKQVEVAVEKPARTRRVIEEKKFNEEKARLTAPPSTPASSPTLEDVRAALRTVFNAKGAGTATELLKKFGATSVSNVKPEDFAAFIKACS